MSTDSGTDQGGRSPRQDFVSIVLSFVKLVRDRNLTFLAAGIAYYAFVSIVPLGLLAFVVASFLGGEALAERVTGMLSQQLSDSGQRIVTEMFANTTGRGAASVVGVLTLTWSALKLFRGLDQAFDELYLDGVETALPEQLRNGLVVVLGIALAVSTVVAGGIAISVVAAQIPFLSVLGPFLLVGALTLAFLPMYYVLPPIDVSLWEVLPGTMVAAVGWVILQIGFQVYASSASQYAAYGLIGAVLLFVTWLYFASIIVLLGVAVNAVRRGIRVDPA